MAEQETVDIRSLFHNSAVPEDVLTEIGRIVTHFALLEIVLNSLVRGLIGLDDRSNRVLTSELSFARLQDVAVSLVKEHHEERVADLKEALKLVSKAESDRNAVLHSRWGLSPFGKDGLAVIRTKYTAKRRKGLDFQREILNAADLRAMAREISVAAYEVEKFAASIGVDTRYP